MKFDTESVAEVTIVHSNVVRVAGARLIFATHEARQMRADPAQQASQLSEQLSPLGSPPRPHAAREQQYRDQCDRRHDDERQNVGEGSGEYSHNILTATSTRASTTHLRGQRTCPRATPPKTL